MKKILTIGPLTPPYNGQAVAYTLVANDLKKNKHININTSRFSNSLLSTLYTIIKTLFAFLFCRFSTIYFTSSRSELGFIKDFLMLVLGGWTNKNIVNHLHGADFKTFYRRSKLLKPFIKYAYKNISTSIVLIDEMKTEYEDFPNMKIKTVSNCYAEELNAGDGKFTKRLQVLYMSNFMASKGILEFLDSCYLLLKGNQNLNVKIAGSPVGDVIMNKKKISNLVYSKISNLLELFPSRVDFVGVVKGENKTKLLFESSIFVLPSYYPTEAYPLSIIEAMRAGNAIVATNHNYLPLIVKASNGIICEPRSSLEIVGGIQALLNDLHLLKKIQDNNMTEAKERYTQQRYINEVKLIIESA